MTPPYFRGYLDGLANSPKEKGLNQQDRKAYENGYRQGHIARSGKGQT